MESKLNLKFGNLNFDLNSSIVCSCVALKNSVYFSEA